MELIITAIRNEAYDVKTFFLKRADGEKLVYKPGQFLTLAVKAGGKEQRRSYSFSSAPGIDAAPSITVKRVDNGLLSRWLIDKAMPGDRLQASESATGIFTLPESLDNFEAVWLFAAGIGITPIYALLKELLYQTTMPRIMLLYSNRGKEQAVFHSSLEKLRQKFPDRLRVIHLWSDSKDMLRARLSKESFPLLRKESLTDNPLRTLCYLCGPATYMWLLQLLLQDAGVPAAAVRREAFVVNEEVPHRLPADKASHAVTIQINGAVKTFTNTYPESILRSAKAAGVTLPYSCNAGQCGSCTAICTEGKVWMSYNEVLTERDLAAGRILTCTGHAVGGDLVLKF